MDSLEIERELKGLLTSLPIGKLEEGELVNTIKKLLELNQLAIGKPNRLNVVLILFQYISNNYWFLFKHKRFNKRIAEKLDELKYDLPSAQYLTDLGIVSEFIESVRSGKADEEIRKEVVKIITDEKDMEYLFDFCDKECEGLGYNIRVLKGIISPKVTKIRLNTNIL